MAKLSQSLWSQSKIIGHNIDFNPTKDIVFDYGEPLAEHPNGMIFVLVDSNNQTLLSETYFSIGGGFINTKKELAQSKAPIASHSAADCPYPFANANQMLAMSKQHKVSIAQMKKENELTKFSAQELSQKLNKICLAMLTCVDNGLANTGTLTGDLMLKRRANSLYKKLNEKSNINDYLCAYAIAVNEENADGRMVVTAPTNGAAGVIPAVLYNLVKHDKISSLQIEDFLLAASAIGGIIKFNSSISGAEVGCQGEVGSAASMAAAGLAAVWNATSEQTENAAEIALEHHLGMTCDPVKGLVQIPCIERNAFGAIKAHTAATLALNGDGQHYISLDKCVAAMQQIGLDMSVKYKETSLGGLAANYVEC